MKYTVAKSVIHVLGTMWMPNTPGATQLNPTAHDVENMHDDDGKVTRESVALWLDSHAGDFSGIIDFYASIEDGQDTIEIPWADEENEPEYNSCMFGDED